MIVSFVVESILRTVLTKLHFFELLPWYTYLKNRFCLTFYDSLENYASCSLRSSTPIILIRTNLYMLSWSEKLFSNKLLVYPPLQIIFDSSVVVLCLLLTTVPYVVIIWDTIHSVKVTSNFVEIPVLVWFMNWYKYQSWTRSL